MIGLERIYDEIFIAKVPIVLLGDEETTLDYLNRPSQEAAHFSRRFH